MAFRRESDSVQDSTSTRAVFSGPDGLRVCRRANLDPTYIGESVYKGPEAKTSDILHMFNGGAGSMHYRSKASWVGEIGWKVHKNDYSKSIKDENKIKRTEFRSELERKAGSYPRII